MNRRSTLLLCAALAAGLMFAGCASAPPPAPDMPRMFTATPPCGPEMDPQSKYATYDAELAARAAAPLPPMDNRDYAMLAGNRAMLDVALGDIPAAGQAATDSQAVMTGKVVGEEGKAVAAALADEKAKVFKGECYEIAMLNCQVGLSQLAGGDDETAAIGFRRALEADKMSKEDARDDFILAYWGLGMATLDNDIEAARQAFTRCGYKSADAVAKENMVFVVYLGRAPWKQLVGVYGEQDQFVMSNYEPRSAEIFVDGVSLGPPTKLVDLFEQSKGVPRTSKDAGQAAKAGGKLVLAALAGVVSSSAQDVVESGWSVCADSRTCYMLPNEVLAVSGRVEPGMHTVRIKFRDAAGAELPRYEQVWYYVNAPKTGRNILFVRDEFDRCNVQGPIAFTRIADVKAQKVKQADPQAAPQATTQIKFRAANLPGVKVGDVVKLCHFYKQTQCRNELTYHWRYRNLQYNTKGESTGWPDCAFCMQDYDIGLVGQAKVTQIDKDTAVAEVVSLTTAYQPAKGDMVTAAQQVGRIWK